jgi:16S rRNA G966 N2-methylase RsmD
LVILAGGLDRRVGLLPARGGRLPQMNGVTLYQGDCLEVLKTLESGSVDAVVTDPPYGISLRSHGQLFGSASEIIGDSSVYLAETIYGICADRNLPVAMFFSPYRWFVNGWRNVLVWNKGVHVGAGGDQKTCWKRDVEMVGIAFNRPLNGNRESSVLNFNAISPNFVGLKHPAEKPLPLMRYLVEKMTQPGDTILDPFMGSGTTGVACVQTGRKFIGIEIDEDYYAIAQKRLNEMDGPLFAGMFTGSQQSYFWEEEK